MEIGGFLILGVERPYISTMNGGMYIKVASLSVCYHF